MNLNMELSNSKTIHRNYFNSKALLSITFQKINIACQVWICGLLVTVSSPFGGQVSRRSDSEDLG